MRTFSNQLKTYYKQINNVPIYFAIFPDFSARPCTHQVELISVLYGPEHITGVMITAGLSFHNVHNPIYRSQK